MRHIFTRLRVSQKLLNLDILKYIHGILFTHTHHTLGGRHVLYEISLKEIGRVHNIHFRGTKHSHHSSIGMSEFLPSNSFFQ